MLICQIKLQMGLILNGRTEKKLNEKDVVFVADSAFAC